MALTAHYVFSISLSHLASFYFWFHGYRELAPLPDEDAPVPEGRDAPVGGSNVAGYA